MVLVCLLAVSAGCARTVYVPQTSYRSIVDTVVRQVADSALLEALFECDSAGKVVMRELNEAKGKLAGQEASFSDGRLRVETRWKTEYIDRVVELRDTVTMVRVQTEVVRQRYVPGFFKWCFAVALGGAVYGLWRIIRGLRRL